MGKTDVERHISKTMHKSNAKSMKSQSTLNFQPVSSTISEKVAKLTYKWSSGTLLSTAVDCQHERRPLFTIDNGVEKMNPLTARIFDSDRGAVTTQFLDMCMSSSTAEGIFSKMQEALSKHEIPWDNCIGIGFDNTSSANVGCIY